MLNRCLTNKLKEIVPIQKWTEDMQSVSHLKIFGFVCYKHRGTLRDYDLYDDFNLGSLLRVSLRSRDMRGSSYNHKGNI